MSDRLFVMLQAIKQSNLINIAQIIRTIRIFGTLDLYWIPVGHICLMLLKRASDSESIKKSGMSIKLSRNNYLVAFVCFNMI